MSRVLVLGDDGHLVGRINVMPGTQVISLSAERIQSPQFDLLRSLDPQALPDVVFFCEEVPIELSLELAAAIDEAYPLVDLVLVGDLPAETVLVAMRSGFRDIISTDATDNHLEDVMRRAGNRAVDLGVAGAPTPITVPPEESRVITVISPKGGVGKTSISTNLAIGMAEVHPSSVVLVDLDLQFGDVASTLDLTPTSTMEHALQPDAAADNLVLKTMLTVHPSGFFVLCGADSPAANEKVAAPQIKRLLHQLSMQFAVVIVDTAAGLDESTLAALEATDDVVVVSTMDVSCVRGVRKEVDLLNEIGLLPASRTLALNMADRQTGMKVKDVEAVIGLPVDVVIPRSLDVQLAANHGQPLMLRKKRGGPFVRAIGALVDRLHRQGELTDSKHKRLEVA
ncbi:AAA family ATPase [Aeromicrobium terrae]|uniref:MinD/ParA family protein n=1 Tax=Aeromicrobium terrae TaxID=2498846 RepID=A0A5C8NMR7_9ACTN|nr:AAA family ATPase [Aeromicrobium terrae]TXL62121.1 MinD/ParA family protein [Aeromicrobium terrae]